MSKQRTQIIQEDVDRIAGHGLPWHTFSGKTVLIAGANGFLPAYMVETLTFLNEVGATKNCKVIGLVRNAGKAEARFPHLLGRSDFSLLAHDVCTPVVIEERIDVVIHAASQASPKYYGKDPVGTLSANTLGTHNLLSLAQRCGAEKFLFFSSCDVYGRVADPDIPAREDSYGYLDPTDLRSCYPESKRLGETMCVAWNHQYRVPVRIVRPAHTYGPGMALDDGRVFADFVANVVRREDIVVKSSGVARRPFCYLADATLAYFTVLLNGEDRQAYNVGNEECELSVGELATILANLFPERKLSVKFLPDFKQAAGYIKNTTDRGTLDTSKLRALGWRPTVNIHEGFRRTILSYEP
jgi:nucleoside-diphosphate-sugar epimerase